MLLLLRLVLIFVFYNSVGKNRLYIRVGMWEGISRPGNGRDEIGGKEIKISVPGDVPGEKQRSAGNPPGRQDTRSLLKIEIITKNRSLLKIETFISSSILARFG